MAKQEWTADREAEALTRLKAGGLSVLIYCRQSVTDLDDEGHIKGASLAVQAKLCGERPEFAKCRVEVFTDADVSGGKEDQRPDYQRMMTRLREAPAGSVGAVVAYDLSRLHRNTANFFNFMAEMERLGILVFTATEGLVHSDDSLSWGVKALVAAEYRRNTGRRISESKRYERAKGVMQGRLPVGYRKREDGKVVIDKKAADVVWRLFSKYASGDYSLTTLADWMNSQGIKPPAVPFRPANAPKDEHAHWYRRDFWSATTIRGMLNTPSYLGLVKIGPRKDGVVVDGPGKNVVKGEHPALIDQSTWDRCQEVAKRNERRSTRTWTRHTYPLTPLLRCARCGGPVNGNRRLHKAGWVNFYRCPASRRYLRPKRDPASCDLPWLRADGLQQALLDELRGLAAEPTVSEALKKGLAKAVDPEAEYRAAMAKLDKRIVNIKFQHEQGHVPNDEYVQRVGAVNIEKNALRAGLDAERKAFNANEWDEKFAVIVAATVAQRTNLDPTALLAPARAQAGGKGRHALGQTVAHHRHDRQYLGIDHSRHGLLDNHTVDESDEIEFGLWAARLPDLLERIEVDVVEKRAAVVLVPRKEWLPYFRQKLPGNASMSFFRSKASSRVSNTWK